MVDATLKEKLLHMDFAGTALVMGASLTLLLALQYAGVTHAWNSSVAISLLVSFVLIVIALIIVEIWEGECAMLTPRLLRKRTVWVNAVWGFFFAGAYFVTLYYLPIYFQSIDNVSPTSSGVRNIPLIALFSIATFGSGKAITKTGVAAPYLVVSSTIVTIGAGLLYTLDVGSSTGHWVGYQILAGFGYGLALQVPVIISQAFAEPADIAPTTAIIICELFFALSHLSADHVPRSQSLDLLAARSCSQLRNPASSIRLYTNLPPPHQASILFLLRKQVPLSYIMCFPDPSGTMSSGRTHGVSRLPSRLQSRLAVSPSLSAY